MALYTTYHNKEHCFKETMHTGRRAEWIRVSGGWIPRHFCGFLHIFFSNIRCAWATLRMLAELRELQIVIIDQVNSSLSFTCVCYFLTTEQVFLPVILCKLFSRAQVIFYCHFPDKLLAARQSLLKKIYRLPFDALEGFAMFLGDSIIVNSNFTQDAFKLAFRRWKQNPPIVLYPSMNIQALDEEILESVNISHAFFLSINRFERKKRLHCAIIAFHSLRIRLKASPRQGPLLILAGGYDGRIEENVTHFQELKRLTCMLNIEHEVLFLPSVSEEMKCFLMRHAVGLLYTPVNEHFGITPLESMALSRPVIACNTGGPCETIVHGNTGYLVNGTPQAFVASMHTLWNDRAKASMLGIEGKMRANALFSFDHFRTELDKIVCTMSCLNRSSSRDQPRY